MEIILKKNIWKLITRYNIRDTNDRDLLRIEKKLFTLSNKHVLTDLTENPLATIKRKVFSLLPHYRVILQNGKVITIRKKPTSIKNKFTIIDDEGEYTVEGDVFENNFIIKKGDEELAKVSKTIIKMFKAYDIQIKDVKNVPMIIAMIIALDIVKYKRLAYFL